MGTPEANPQGYESSSRSQKAAALEADLLLIHGASDDNVHLANTLAFVAALVKAGKPYALQVHPRQLHGFRAKEDRVARRPRARLALRAHPEARQLAARPRPRHHLQPAAEGRLEACAQAAHAPRGSALTRTSTSPPRTRQSRLPRTPGGVRSVISSASASSTAARSSGSASSRVTSGASERPWRSSSSPAWRTVAASSATCRCEKPGEVGREHQVRDVLVAVEEVDRAPDVEDARGLQQRVLQLGRGPGLERLVERAGELLAPLPALPRPAHEARRERVERAVPHARHRLERVARHAERQALAHALARHHDARGVQQVHERLDHDGRRRPPSPGGRRSGPARARASSASRRRARR